MRPSATSLFRPPAEEACKLLESEQLGIGNECLATIALAEGVRAANAGLKKGAVAPQICGYLMEALQVLEELRKQNLCAQTHNGREPTVSSEVEANRFLELELYVQQLFAVYGFHLTMDGEVHIAFSEDITKAKVRGESSGCVEGVDIAALTNIILQKMSSLSSDTASKLLVEISKGY